MSLELSTHFVAFIDILGFSEMVRLDCESSDGPKYLELLYDVHRHAASELGKDIEAGLIQFSDSIVFSRPFDIGELGSFIYAVSAWQKSLLLSGLLCRGGITFGKHFVKDRFMFSKGLIDAYRLETRTARFPRIVVSDDLMQLACTQINLSHLPIITEEDSVVFVDYLTYENDENRQDLEHAVREVCATSSDNSSIQEKLRWLAHYADYKLNSGISGPRFT